MSWRHMNRTSRSLPPFWRSSASWTKTKSGNDTWLLASTTGPVAGTCSCPSDRTVSRERPQQPAPAADHAPVEAVAAHAATATQANGGRWSRAIERRPAQRQTRAARSRSSSVTRLPIQRRARVISQSDRIPAGPRVAAGAGR